MIAIDARNLTKVYKIYQSPTHRIKEIFLRRPYHKDFKALDGINFSVLKGGTFGIIGENGAGKSTLLKILAKTLRPTSGNLITNGRLAALLELGAGFNPELTGEENIYLNAYLMGLSKGEIDSKKGDIIGFSELGESIARPVKTYSSGMHVRLAFSIATSVDPEILIVDEALSVGDEYFQKKCIDRMMDFRRRGKTIVFCSHSMYHIQELCKRAMWLHNGRIKTVDEAGKTIMEYQNHERGKSAGLKSDVSEMLSEPVEGVEKTLQILDMKVIGKDGSETEMISTFDPVVLSFRIGCRKRDIKGHIGFGIIRNDEIIVFLTMTNFEERAPIQFSDGQEFQVKIKSLPLLPGIYHFGAVIVDEFALHPYDMQRAKSVQVKPGRKEFGTSYIEHEWLS
jgi:lipopolysaccharide transport system ATP-binding protein